MTLLSWQILAQRRLEMEARRAAEAEAKKRARPAEDGAAAGAERLRLLRREYARGGVLRALARDELREVLERDVLAALVIGRLVVGLDELARVVAGRLVAGRNAGVDVERALVDLLLDVLLAPLDELLELLQLREVHAVQVLPDDADVVVEPDALADVEGEVDELRLQNAHLHLLRGIFCFIEYADKRKRGNAERPISEEEEEGGR